MGPTAIVLRSFGDPAGVQRLMPVDTPEIGTETGTRKPVPISDAYTVYRIFLVAVSSNE